MNRGVFALVPVKDPALGKSRLAAVLDAPARAALNLRLTRQTFECCASAFGADRTVVITASASIAAEAVARGLVLVREESVGDLNAALEAAAARAIERGAQALLVVPVDLVQLTPDALHAVASNLEAAGVVLVPDRHGTGTNLLGVRPARPDVFRFGERSLGAHRAAGAEAGIAVRVHADAALALDLDTPEDYRLWRSVGAADSNR
jgi:2-phospho-L-lactate guanylyltransferase